MMLQRLGAALSTGQADGPGVPPPQYRPQRHIMSGFWAVLALFFAGLGQFYFHNKLPLLDGFLFYAVGVFAFWRMLSRTSPLSPLAIARNGKPPSPIQRRWAYTVGGLAVALAVGALMSTVTEAPFLPAQLLVLCAGGAWIIAGALLDGSPKVNAEALHRTLRAISRRDRLILAGILLLATGLRFYRLGELPFGLWYDEAAIGLEGHRILTDQTYRPLYSPSTTSPTAFVYLVAAAEALFDKTVFAVRLIPALAGVLSTLMAYLVGRTLFGPWAGLCAAALFGVARWDINFSRLGMQGATTPFLTLLVCALALAALSSARMVTYAALGVLAGALIWFYSANLVFPLVLLILLVAVMLQQRDYLKTHRLGLAFALGGTLLVVAPVLLQAWPAPDVFFGRAQQASILRGKRPAEAADAAVESLGKHLLMFQVRGDRNGRHNLPGEPMLDWLTGIFMVLGIVAAVRWWRDIRSLLLLSWLFVMLLPGVLSLEFEAPQGLRSIGALPAAILLAALGLDRSTTLLRPFLSRKQCGAAAVLGISLVTIMNAGTYFGTQASNFAVWNGFSVAESLVGRRLAEAERQGERVLVSLFYKGHPTVKFFSDAPTETFDAAKHLPLKRDVTTTIFLDPLEEATYQLLQRFYPEGDCKGLRQQPDGPVVLYTCTVPAEVIQASRGLVARYFGSEALGSPVLREEILLSTAVPPLSSSDGITYHIGIDGSFLAPSFGLYRFAFEGSPTATLSLDGEERLVGGSEPVIIKLAQGLHKFRVSGMVTNTAGPVRLLWQPPGGQWAIMPKEVLFHGSVRPMGLSGSYGPGAARQVTIAFQQVDATPAIYFHVPPLELPFNVQWTGSLYVKTPGTYNFTLTSITLAQLEIADKVVVATREPGVAQVGALDLARGWHKLRLNYLAAAPYAQVFLRWTPPDNPYGLIPPDALRPW